MKYLSKEPFSSKPSSKEYRNGWDRTFMANSRSSRARDKAVEAWMDDWNNLATHAPIPLKSELLKLKKPRSLEQPVKGVGPLPTTGLAGKRRKP